MESIHRDFARKMRKPGAIHWNESTLAPHNATLQRPATRGLPAVSENRFRASAGRRQLPGLSLLVAIALRIGPSRGLHDCTAR